MGRRTSVDHAKIYTLLEQGYKQKDVAKIVGCNVMTVSKAARKHKVRVDERKKFDVEKFEKSYVVNLTYTLHQFLEEISTRPLSHATIGQLVTSFEKLNNMKLLAEGKATQHIAVQAYHNLSEEDRTLLRETIGAYKQSQLKKIDYAEPDGG